MTVPRADFAAVTLFGGKVLLIGGQTSADADTSAVDVFDPSSGTMTPAASMPSPRSGHVAVLLSNGKVLVAGGSGAPNGPALTTAELYDPGTNTWSAAASMAQAREHSAVIVMRNGKVFVAGGDGGAGPDPTGSEIYDPATNTWTGAQTFYGDRPNGPAVALLQDGRILTYGGTAVVQPGNQYELYDPSTGQASFGRSIPDTYDFTTAAVLADGSVLFVGGRAGYNPAGPVNTTLVFTPSPESFTAGPAMDVGHCHHTMTGLPPNGRLLVAGGGGCGGAQSIAIAEIYDPASKTWSLAGTMHVARGYHVAVLLTDGQVLVAGGFGSDGAPTATTEIYTPA